MPALGQGTNAAGAPWIFGKGQRSSEVWEGHSGEVQQTSLLGCNTWTEQSRDTTTSTSIWRSAGSNIELCRHQGSTLDPYPSFPLGHPFSYPHPHLAHTITVQC